jgi:hypothetical protein
VQQPEYDYLSQQQYGGIAQQIFGYTPQNGHARRYVQFTVVVFLKLYIAVIS